MVSINKPEALKAPSKQDIDHLKVILYLDMGSQPARAILGFCLMNGIRHEVKLVAIRKGEHMSDEYSKINPA